MVLVYGKQINSTMQLNSTTQCNSAIRNTIQAARGGAHPPHDAAAWRTELKRRIELNRRTELFNINAQEAHRG